MFAKLAMVLIAATALGAALLGLRQQRVQTVGAMAALHARMNATRQMLWDTQVRIAEASSPPRLREALQRAGLATEPINAPPVEASTQAAPDRGRVPLIAAGRHHDRD